MNNQAAQTMPELPDSQYRGGNDVFGKEFPLYTADQMHQYARDYAAALSQTAGVPDVLFDGYAVYQGMSDEARARINAGGVSDVLDSVVRLIRAQAAPAASGGEPAASVSERARGYRQSTHHVHRGPESLPCYCTATIDHQIDKEASDGEALARRFHETYERLAPSFGYETRTETRQFDPTTPNGRLMIAVCSELALEQALTQQRGEVSWKHDAESWGNALNEAAWTFVEQCSEKSALLFNNTKAPLRAAILKYAELVGATTTPQPSADAVRELAATWRKRAERKRFVGLKNEALLDEAHADELESLLSAASGEKGVG